MSDKKGIFIYLPILLAISVVGGIFLGSRFNITSGEGSGFRKQNKMNEVLNYIFEEYVDSVDKTKLVEGSLSSILKDLDPHSSYIPAAELGGVNEPLEGNFEGIGIEFNVIQDTIVVISPISGGPSEAMGIEAGDRIVKIEQDNVAGVNISNNEVITRLRGPSGTTVQISIIRRGTTATIDYTITRGKIPLHSVDVAYMVNDSIGYIKINRFSAKTYKEYMRAFASLEKNNLTGLILDLRGNPGGYLSAAISVSDEYLEDGQLIVYTEGKSHPKTPYLASKRGKYKSGNLVVLIDEGSASASEIVAGAVQDSDRGIILGRRSFGKGLVQEQFVFPDGSAVRLTIARYYTPTGRCIQRPYKDGLENYYYDIYKRYSDDGIIESDSAYFNDSLKYITPGGKVVYGGGGIMPDVFVPFDTIGQSQYLSKILSNGIINQYAFDYVDKNRKELNAYKNVKDFSAKFNIRRSELAEFISFAEAKGEPANYKDIKYSENIIKTRIKAQIARHVWNNDGFYPIIHQIDNTFLKAVDKMSSGDADPLAAIN